jgi:hypothetical protein
VPLKWNLYCAPDTNIVHVESVALLALDFWLSAYCTLMHLP